MARCREGWAGAIAAIAVLNPNGKGGGAGPGRTLAADFMDSLQVNIGSALEVPQQAGLAPKFPCRRRTTLGQLHPLQLLC